MKKLVLIDSNALVHRAFHALPAMNAPDGRPTNAVYGFTSVLLKMLSDLKPDYIAATFDLAGPTFRHREYEEYKAQRERAPDELYAQIPAVKDMLAALGIPVFEKEGYEADDIIGTIALATRDTPGVQTIIVTGDLDTLQLVHRKKTVVFTLRKGMTDTVTYDEEAVRARFGLEPEQIADLKGLKGDPSDNIPGVTGIGEKTAAALITQFGSIERLYAEIEKPEFARTKGANGGVSEKLRDKLLEQKDMAFFSKKLATIVLDVPITFSLEQTDWQRGIDAKALDARCKELGFFSLAKRIPAVLGAIISAGAAQPLALDGGPVKPPSSVRVASGPDELPGGEKAIVHASLHADGIGKLWVTTDGATVHELNLPSAPEVQRALERYPVLVGHGLKPLLRMLPDLSGLRRHTIIDTEVGAWLISPELRDYSLERVMYDAASQTLPDDQSSWPLAIGNLWPLLESRLRKLGLFALFSDLEMPLIPVLAAMERTGIRVDVRTIDSLQEVARETVRTLEKRIWKLAGGEFNINSPAQLGEVLFTKLGVKGRVRRTTSGAPSTAAPELEKLRDEYPIVDLILQYREMAKLKATYIEPFPTLVGSDGRIHTTYHQTGTATGRLSSSDPNLQNVPTRTELGSRFRAAFVADPGWKLLSLDYSQLELRLVAHIADDATMIEAFKTGEDIHTRTASEVFGVAPGAVTKDMRRQAKVLNFGIIYGMGSLGFARAGGIGRDEAKRFIEQYFARFPGIARYMERTKQEAFENGFVETLLGRRRPLPDITSRIPQLAAAAERMAINHPIQGTGADLMKLAMLAVDRLLRDDALASSARMLLQVHDELVLEVRSEEVDRVADQIRTAMETVYRLNVPLVVDAKVGDNWADMSLLSHA